MAINFVSTEWIACGKSYVEFPGKERAEVVHAFLRMIEGTGRKENRSHVELVRQICFDLVYRVQFFISRGRILKTNTLTDSYA